MKKQPKREYVAPTYFYACLQRQIPLCASQWGSLDQAGNDINGTSEEGDIFEF